MMCGRWKQKLSTSVPMGSPWCSPAHGKSRKMTNLEQRGAAHTEEEEEEEAIGETKGDEPEWASDVEVVASDIRSDLES
jgi:hypothetical protein